MLLASDEDEVFKQHLVTATWELTNALPGDPCVYGNINLENAGTRRGNSLSITVVNAGTGGAAIAKEIIAESMTYNGQNLLPFVSAAGDGHSGVSMLDLELQGGVPNLSGLNPPPPYGTDGTKSFSMCLKLHDDAPEGLAGKTWLGTFTFVLSQ